MMGQENNEEKTFIVLSQKIDTESAYSDELFRLYHFPAKYARQIHEGDIYIYYQGDRYHRERRYYYGTGEVRKIISSDNESWYAELAGGEKFEIKVPIYLDNGGYVEQLGYSGNRKMPSFQTSIRRISKEAYEYILTYAGKLTPVPAGRIGKGIYSEEELNQKLMDAVSKYFLSRGTESLDEIISIAEALKNHFHVKYDSMQVDKNQLIDYCKSMKMSFSYKPVLIKALLQYSEYTGRIKIEDAAKYFRDYYTSRLKKGLKVEKNNCVLKKADISNCEIEKNIIGNPVRALSGSVYFEYDSDNRVFGMKQNIWKKLTPKDKENLIKICDGRIENYFSSH